MPRNPPVLEKLPPVRRRLALNLVPWLAAQVMVERCDTDAAQQAANRAHELLVAGDTDGQQTWLQIVRAIEALVATTPVV